MLQAALPDCLFFDLLSFPQDGFVAPEVDIGWCDVVQALVVTLVVIVVDESPDLTLEISRQVIVFQQNPVLHGLMPTFDLALCLRGGTVRRAHGPFSDLPTIRLNRRRCSRIHCH